MILAGSPCRQPCSFLTVDVGTSWTQITEFLQIRNTKTLFTGVSVPMKSVFVECVVFDRDSIFEQWRQQRNWGSCSQSKYNALPENNFKLGVWLMCIGVHITSSPVSTIYIYIYSSIYSIATFTVSCVFLVIVYVCFLMSLCLFTCVIQSCG